MSAGDGGRRRRRSELRRVRQRRRLRAGLVLFVLLVVLAGLGGAAVLYGPALLDRLGAPTDGPADASDPTRRDDQPVIAVATVHPTDRAAGATSVVILGGDGGAEANTMLLVPTATVTDIPGHGIDELARAQTYGGAGLLHATLENLLGLRIDALATITDRGWERLVDGVGGLRIELDRRVVLRDADGNVTDDLEAGEHDVDGAQAARLVAGRGTDESDLDHLTRLRRLVAALLAETAADEDLLRAHVEGRITSLQTVADPRTVGAGWVAAARAAAADRLDAVLLPVSPLTSGQAGYRADTDRTQSLLADRFPGAVRSADDLVGRRLRVLNGNGMPGVGQLVAERVVPAGFRIVLTDNADRFDHQTTRVIVHGDDEAAVEAGRELVRHLGVGAVEMTSTAQSVADLTVIVGHDFVEQDGGG